MPKDNDITPPLSLIAKTVGTIIAGAVSVLAGQQLLNMREDAAVIGGFMLLGCGFLLAPYTAINLWREWRSEIDSYSQANDTEGNDDNEEV